MVLERLISELRSSAGDSVQIDRRVAENTTAPFVGYEVASSSRQAASLEVWEGRGGWNMFVEDALNLELAPSDEELLTSIFWATIEGGCLVARVGLSFEFVAGVASLDGRKGAEIALWEPWPEVNGNHLWEPITIAVAPYHGRGSGK